MLSSIYIVTSEDFASAAVKLVIFQICSALLRWWVVLLIFCRLKLMTGNVNKNWGGELTAASETSHCKRLFITEFYGEFPDPGRALESFIPIGWVTSENLLKEEIPEYTITPTGPNLSTVCVCIVFVSSKPRVLNPVNGNQHSCKV